MFVIQRLYAGNKYLSQLADKSYSSDINKAFCFSTLQHAKAVKKGLKLFSVRIIEKSVWFIPRMELILHVNNANGDTKC